MTRRCDKCECWEAPDKDSGRTFGVCRRLAPVDRPGADMFPQMYPHEWCWEGFVAKAEPKPVDPPEPTLKPCPHCGGEAMDDWDTARRVGCPVCYIWADFLGKGKVERVAAWNRRTP